jgi:quercetin dioxygenase-like cupin family protein
MTSSGFGRRVVTAEDGIASDGPSPRTIDVPGSFGVSELLWLDGPPAGVADGADRANDGFPLEPPPGGASARVIRMPATGEWLRVEGDDDARPGMHATDTLDFVVVLDGAIVLGTQDGHETLVHAGDFVVQRGTAHRWRVAGDGPCTYFVAMLRPDPARAAADLTWWRGSDRSARRIVTDGDTAIDGWSDAGLEGGATRLVDVWHTGGPLSRATQGGDPRGPWALEPPTGGAWFRRVDLQPGRPSDAGWHRTRSIDLDVVLSGRLGLDLANGDSVDLWPGDAVVQRGTNHRWRVIGDDPVQFAAVMLALS